MTSVTDQWGHLPIGPSLYFSITGWSKVIRIVDYWLVGLVYVCSLRVQWPPIERPSQCPLCSWQLFLLPNIVYDSIVEHHVLEILNVCYLFNSARRQCLLMWSAIYDIGDRNTNPYLFTFKVLNRPITVTLYTIRDTRTSKQSRCWQWYLFRLWHGN